MQHLTPPLCAQRRAGDLRSGRRRCCRDTTSAPSLADSVGVPLPLFPAQRRASSASRRRRSASHSASTLPLRRALPPSSPLCEPAASRAFAVQLTPEAASLDCTARDRGSISVSPFRRRYPSLSSSSTPSPPRWSSGRTSRPSCRPCVSRRASRRRRCPSGRRRSPPSPP